MLLLQLSKLAVASALFSSTNAQASKTLTSPSNGFKDPIPRPTGQWISPEYKWFFQSPLPIPPQKTKKYTWTDSSTGAEIDYYELEVKPFKQQIYPDLPATDLIGYDGISPGPYFVMQQGREAVARFINNGPAKMSVHVHGQYNRAPFDGWASDYANPGEYKDYYYPNAQNARTIWYHTGENAYRGQEGGYIITDAHEESLNLPKGNYDVPLTFATKAYNADGSLKWDDGEPDGLWGDIMQVNGQPWPYFSVEPRKYRFRMLDGSVSRSYLFSFVEGLNGTAIDFQVIASDGGLLSHPVTTNSISMSPGERYEIIFDFTKYSGKSITMRNAFGVGDAVDYAATNMMMRFNVGNSVNDNTNNGDVPQVLRSIPPIPTSDPVKDFTFARPDKEWLINGVGFDDIAHRILTRPVRGEDEIWTLHNGGGGTHPVHIHLVDFQILSRTGGRNQVLPYEAAGRKDIVWLSSGETVNVVARYAPWAGVYMFHCHNLIHEDNDMLVAFNVTNLANWGYTNDTLFIDPMQPEFRPKPYKAADSTEDAIMAKIAWLYSTGAYNKDNVAGVYSALDNGSGQTNSAASATASGVVAKRSTFATSVVTPTSAFSSSRGSQSQVFATRGWR